MVVSVSVSVSVGVSVLQRKQRKLPAENCAVGIVSEFSRLRN